jgi:hypothetical protein
MDEELKGYLDGVAADIARSLAEMESRIISALKSPQSRVEAEAEKLELGTEVPHSDIERIQAGH